MGQIQYAYEGIIVKQERAQVPVLQEHERGTRNEISNNQVINELLIRQF